MTINEYLRLIAGTMLILSLVLTVWVHPYFVFFTAFIALNLIQSAFTRWCPMITLLRKLNVKEA